MCMFDEFGEMGCLKCDLPDCMRDDILDDSEIEESYSTEKAPINPRRYARYKGTYFDDERHRKARENYHKRKQGLIEVRQYKYKGREAEYHREYRANQSEEVKERYRAKQRARNRKLLESMSEEERKEYLEKRRAYDREYKKNMSEEQKERYRERQRERRKNMTEEQRREYLNYFKMRKLRKKMERKTA